MIKIFGSKSTTALLAALTISFALPSNALAHHSFAMFDSTKEVVLDGVVRDFQWTNPHSWIQLVVQENGKAVEYGIEMGSPNNYSRQGWTRNSLKAGDHIKLTVHPRKDGTKGGSFVKVVKADGSTLGYQF